MVASCLLALSLWPGGETVVDITNFSEVVLEVVGGFSSNLDWERMVYGFCYLSLLFLYFSFKIINVHNTFESFVCGYEIIDYLCNDLEISCVFIYTGCRGVPRETRLFYISK